MAKESVGFAEVVMQQRITNRLLAAQLKESMNQNELVALLSGTGAGNQEIADILDTTPAVVATTLHRLKKKKGKTASSQKRPE